MRIIFRYKLIAILSSSKLRKTPLQKKNRNKKHNMGKWHAIYSATYQYQFITFVRIFCYSWEQNSRSELGSRQLGDRSPQRNQLNMTFKLTAPTRRLPTTLQRTSAFSYECVIYKLAFNLELKKFAHVKMLSYYADECKARMPRMLHMERRKMASV